MDGMIDQTLVEDSPEQFKNGEDSEKSKVASETFAPVHSAGPRPAKSNGKVSSDQVPGNISILMDVSLLVTVELGRTRMTVRDVLDIQNGTIVELDRIAGEAVDVYANDLLLARGEVVVVDDKFGVRVTELIASEKEIGVS